MTCPENEDLARLLVTLRVLILKWTSEGARSEVMSEADPQFAPDPEARAYLAGEAKAYKQCIGEMCDFLDALELELPPDHVIEDVLREVLQKQGGEVN